MFLNLSKDVLGIEPWDGTTFQVSSFGRRARSLPGTPGAMQRKYVDIRPGELFTLADLEGPGLITRIWMTMPQPLNPRALRDLSVSMSWDGEPSPSVLAPLGDLFGATFGRPREYRSAYLAFTSGAHLCLFPMPFRERALLQVRNDGRRTVRLFFFQVTYLKLHRAIEEAVPYFHCCWHRERMGREEPPFTVLEAEGRGLYMGCHLDMQGAGYPWRPNPLRWLLPEGFGMGMLEGWEQIWIDGEGPTVQGTGGEDYFNGAWYFTKVPSTGLTHGVTKRDYVTRRVSCYRFHTEMPVSFAARLKVTMDHGFDNALPATYDGTAFWYQQEPHRPYAPLPGAPERAVQGGVRNALVMAAPFAYAAGGFVAAGRLLSRRRCGLP